MSQETEHISPNGPDPRLPWYKRVAGAVRRGVSWIKQAAAGILVLDPDKIRKEQLATGRVGGQNGAYPGLQGAGAAGQPGNTPDAEKDPLPGILKRALRSASNEDESGPNLKEMLQAAIAFFEDIRAYFTGTPRRSGTSFAAEIETPENMARGPRAKGLVQTFSHGGAAANDGRFDMAMNDPIFNQGTPERSEREVKLAVNGLPLFTAPEPHI